MFRHKGEIVIMKKNFRRNAVAIAIYSALSMGIVGCGGGSSSSTSSGSVSGLALPDSVEVVSADSSGSTANVAALKTNFAGLAAAFNDAGTDYSNDDQQLFVWHPALQPINTVNDILCFVGQMRADQMVNKGAYIALIDEGSCSSGESAGSSTQQGGQSSGAANTPSFTKAIVNVTRESNSDPMTVSVWIEDMEGPGGSTMTIKAKSVVTEGVSDEKPFGSFTLTYDMIAADGTVVGSGELKTVDAVNGKVGFTHYESTEEDFMGSGTPMTFVQRASVVMAPDGSDGVALTSGKLDGADFAQMDETYALAYNTQHVLVQNADSYDQLPYVASGDHNSGTCLKRDSFDEAVYRYDLYDAETGARVDLNSGFPIEYDSDGDGANDGFGYLSYWGLWTEDGSSFSSGDTIYRVDYSTGEQTPYTVIQAPGRLIKNTVETVPLTDIEGVDLYYWDSNMTMGGQPIDQWVVRYLSSSSNSGFSAPGFYKVGGLTWGENGPTVTELTTYELVTTGMSNGMPVNFFSDALGGNLNYVVGSSNVTFTKEEFMTGAESEFANGSLTLKCVDQCIKGTLTSSDLSTWDGPFATASASSPVTYTISNTGNDAMTLINTGNSQAVRYDASLNESNVQGSMYDWGVRSGPMVTEDVFNSVTSESQLYDGSITTYYTWETGVNQWNQLTMVKDGNGSLVSFDKPIEFSYTHSTANDRAGSSTYDGNVFMVGYGGNGDFWGIPFENACENDSTCNGMDRWFPAFNIKDGVTMGPNGEYVIKAREIERKMQPETGTCTVVVNDPAAPLPDGVTGTADIGDMPTVDAAPAVIGGELQSGS